MHLAASRAITLMTDYIAQNLKSAVKNRVDNKYCKERQVKVQMAGVKREVPRSLKNWFFVHFVVDVLFAIPLMLMPVYFLSILGWQVVDPVAARLVAAALFGIGIESLLSYNATIDNYKGLLNLKIIWSLAALVGLLISLIQGDHGRTPVLWLLILTFIFFNGLWVYWKLKISRF